MPSSRGRHLERSLTVLVLAGGAPARAHARR
jgi:hypothetical protein